MGSTNKTTNYELSQYIGTDKPSWLNDYNNDMLKIDTQMKANATAAANAQSTATSADGKADANTLAIGTLDTQINTPSTGLAATVAGHTTEIGTINGEIGNTPLTTVAQTLTGAIEEIKGNIPSITGLLSFVNTKTLTVTGDGSSTYTQLMNQLHNSLQAYVSSQIAGYMFIIKAATISAGFVHLNTGLITSAPTEIVLRRFNITQSGPQYYAGALRSAGSYLESYVGTTYTDLGSEIVPNGTNLSVTFDEFILK